VKPEQVELLPELLQARTAARKFSIGGLCDFSGGFAFVRGVDIIKLIKTPLIYSVSRFNLGGLELCLWGLTGLLQAIAEEYAGKS